MRKITETLTCDICGTLKQNDPPDAQPDLPIEPKAKSTWLIFDVRNGLDGREKLKDRAVCPSCVEIIAKKLKRTGEARNGEAPAPVPLLPSRPTEQEKKEA